MSTDLNPVFLREEGIRLYYNPERDKAKREQGVELLLLAKKQGDDEAAYFLGSKLLATVKPGEKDKEAEALEYLHFAGERGHPTARNMLFRICNERYSEYAKAWNRKPSAPLPLTDWEGRPFRINRVGLAYPVEAQLSFDGWTNNLDLCARVDFSCLDSQDIDFEHCTTEIEKGFQDWAGNYHVFGGQPLSVSVRLKPFVPFRNRITIVALSEEFGDKVATVTEKIVPGDRSKDVRRIFGTRRSFSAMGLRRWSIRSIKNIFFSYDDLNEKDDYLRCAARHEFGHILGLGDLYASEEDGLAGVKAGTFPVLDCYRLYDKTYYRVMNDDWAPVTDNDIEMVLLALSRNKFQSFQEEGMGEISKALLM